MGTMQGVWLFVCSQGPRGDRSHVYEISRKCKTSKQIWVMDWDSGLTAKGYEGTSQGWWNVLKVDCGDSYTIVQI